MQKEKKKVLYSQIVKDCIMRIVSCILLLSSLVFCSCSLKQDNVVISKKFQNEEWGRFEYLEGTFDVNNAPENYDVVVEVVVNESYPNPYEIHQDDCPLLINLTIKNPDSNGSRSKDYKFMLKDKDGNWKADRGEDGCYVFKLPIISEMTFSDDGTYSFKMENKYPKDPLYGIKSVTLKCLNSK